MKFLLCLAVLFSSLARAGWQDQYAGLWWNPAQPGWGVFVQQQAGHARLTLLVYGNDGQAQWFYSPDTLLPPSDFHAYDDYDRAVTFGGTLFQPGATPRAVGSITLSVDRQRGEVSYSIENVTRSAPIVRALLERTDLAGDYAGARSVANMEEYIRLTAWRDADDVRLRLDNGIGTCELTGRFTEAGPAASISGNARCVRMGDFPAARFEARDVRVEHDSLSFHYDIFDSGGAQSGSVNVARTVARSDETPPRDNLGGLWILDRQPWSILVHHEGNTLFAIALDASGKWFVASNAAYQPTLDLFAGELWSTEATPYSRSYDPSQLRASRRGQLVLAPYDGDYSTASLEIDGVGAQGYVQRSGYNNAALGGSYLAVRTSLWSAIPSADIGTWSIRQNSIEVRITVEEENRHCEITGALGWRGVIGEIDGFGTCTGPGYPTHTGRFFASNVRLTDQGLSMRYWFLDEIGAVAGVALAGQ